jgi:ATP-binding cassette, subfamily B, multidrug efflux pump
VTFPQLILGFARRHWRAYAAAGAMLVLIAVLTVWVPRRVGHIVDAFVAGTLAGSALWRELAILLAMGVAIYLLRVGWRLALFAAAYQLGVELRVRLYERLSLQGPPFFHRQRTGDLMALATNDVDAVEMAAGEAFLAGFDGTLTLVLVVAMMTIGVDWRLGLVALLPFPFMAFAFFVIARNIHRASRTSLESFSSLNEHVQETVAAVRTLRAQGLESRAGVEFAERARAAGDAGFDAQRWEARFEPAVGFTLAIAAALTLAVSGWLVLRGEMTVGQLTSFTMYLVQLIWPMFAAGWVLALIQRGKAAWVRLDPVLQAPLSVDDHGAVASGPVGAIRCDGVTFAYPATADGNPEVVARRVLDDVALVVEPGATLGVVGPTGAGKSTLLALLLRHYAPQQGTLRWGEAALSDYTLESLRGAMAWVPQEAFLFSGSIADNIALAAPGATPAEIEHAARVADLHDDIQRFPRGYATLVGERGVTLSGGQRQRLAIARALLTDAPLLLLDDALSAVDTGTETRILEHLRAARRGRSAIIVSHRLSAVVDADSIIVLQAGRVIERGTHVELVALDGWYAAQWRYQQLEAMIENEP